MHEPEFGKKCYDCTHRFICWTSREKLPEITGLPRCDKCQMPLEVIGDPYEKHISSHTVLMVRAKCPNKRFHNSHSGGRYLHMKDGKWICM